MKTLMRISFIFFSVFFVGFFSSCEKKPVQQINLPILITDPVSQIAPTSAYSGGYVMENGGGKISAKGLCWSTTKFPTTDDFKTDEGPGGEGFWTKMSGLIPGTTYYWVRSYATNEAGTAYGDQLGFSTPTVDPVNFNESLTYGSLTDIDNNIYRTIQIGTQTWMAENLKVSKLNDGTSLSLASDFVAWKQFEGPGCTYYDFSPQVYKPVYGALYNWDAASSGKLCPAGWHVPADSEWTVLTTYLGDDSELGKKLKEAGASHWYYPLGTITNESGFTALPGSLIYWDWTAFSQIGNDGFLWSATPSEYSSEAYCRSLARYHNHFYKQSMYKKNGLSVRCLKDAEKK
jgi:uncharacterized protein (TIGR02145 family)